MKVKLTAAFMFAALITASLPVLSSDDASAEAAQGDASAGEGKAAVCTACHGVGGNSTNPQWPKLAGQNEKYLINQLMLFKSNTRVNAIMNAQAAGLSEQDMRDIAAYYASLETSPGAASDEKKAVMGMKIYMGGNLETGVIACVACHSPDGKGNSPGGFPALSGQHAEYTALQLTAYKNGERVNENLKMMNEIADKMSENEIQAVAEYIAGLH